MITTDNLIANAHTNREGEAYPDMQTLFVNLPVVLRGICDFALTDEATKEEIARALASVIDVIENAGSKTIQ
jgi:hypothetical protein